MLDIYVQVQKEIGKTNCPFEISAPEVVLYYLKPSCFMESLLFSKENICIIVKIDNIK